MDLLPRPLLLPVLRNSSSAQAISLTTTIRQPSSPASISPPRRPSSPSLPSFSNHCHLSPKSPSRSTSPPPPKSIKIAASTPAADFINTTAAISAAAPGLSTTTVAIHLLTTTSRRTTTTPFLKSDRRAPLPLPLSIPNLRRPTIVGRCHRPPQRPSLQNRTAAAAHLLPPFLFPSPLLRYHRRALILVVEPTALSPLPFLPFAATAVLDSCLSQFVGSVFQGKETNREKPQNLGTTK